MVPELSLGWLFAKTLIAMVVVVLLAIVFLRYLLPRWHRFQPNPKSKLRILERFGLEPRKALYIVQVGKKRALVGTSDHAIAKLMDLDAEDFEIK